ncbi:hypothetical protein B5S28_g112 [[Candida] boidinii]|uniref:Unnamed protein product n=1 Tax=Candida boidinii TaxID=5477 RepID=A0ACB5TXG4_CANBO|nr:hypothetical protein B5S28_g112 [[Candida] boidinii]OWB59419.1 hypothetical protein B5S29_g276 [[Candida] boidinii]OWB73428.1 hypothetical protein B5S31_g3170 [[Candida] boidinii]OWB76357.1 hypothetical protein B5S32_g508 [[Candida] boidinii]GME97298.1 unnamed protein product [[Candida] boidinii]
MVKYTIEELLSYESAGVIPAGVDLSAFVKLVEEVKLAMNEFEENAAGFQTGRRRSSFHKFKKVHKPKEVKQVDADGWTTTVAVGKGRKSIGAEDADFKEKDREVLKQHTLKVKTSSSKISSGKSSSKTAEAITHSSAFNAFDALNEDESDDNEDEEDEE